MNSTGIDQKEYLKKYLGVGKDSGGKKKKKKKSKKIENGLKIIDDDVDVRLNEEIQMDLGADNDEAPQIVSVIDDRPPSLRIDEETLGKLWKPIGASSDAYEQIEKGIKFEGNIKLLGNSEIKQPSKHKTDFSPISRYKESKKIFSGSPISINKEISLSSGKRNFKINTLDVLNKVKEENISPNRDFLPERHHGKSKDISCPRRDSIQISSDCDKSPARRRHDKGSSLKKIKNRGSNDSPRRSKIDEDISPVRKKKENGDFSPVGWHKNEDISPPRRHRTQINFDSHSSLRKMYAKRLADDSSTLRKTKSGSSDNSPKRSRIDWDISPTRKWDFLPPQRGQTKEMSATRQAKADDFSLPVKSRSEKHEDLSPPRRERGAEAGSFPSRKIKIAESEDNSPPKGKKSSKRSRWDDSEESNGKMEKTLDGKTAGLQYVTDLVKETQQLKKQEDELFRKLSLEVSGANAATVVRRKQNEVSFEEEKKLQVEQDNKEKYNRWGRGLKQVDDVNEKIKSDLYEMSKPLARYADDEDLEKHLKDQERDGDPMLAYIKQKKRKKAVEEGLPVLQQYEGDSPPNRFGIRPGYRWDGVDRSNGYEKKWFQVQNSRKANIEESYKWSTEDM